MKCPAPATGELVSCRRDHNAPAARLPAETTAEPPAGRAAIIKTIMAPQRPGSSAADRKPVHPSAPAHARHSKRIFVSFS
jgi:hypothetical protein